MTSTLLIGVFVLFIGLLLMFSSLYGLILHLRKGNKMGLWTKLRNWWAMETKFEEWMKSNHPSLEYEYNTRYLEWTRNTNRQTWRKRMMLLFSFVLIVAMVFDGYFAGMIVGAAVFILVMLTVNYCTVGRLEDERKGALVQPWSELEE